MSRIIEALQRGDYVEVPTDTVFGLAALPGSYGYEQIFDVKKRPREQVLPWLISGADDLQRLGADIPEYTFRLAEMFWPGALTLVVMASDTARETGEVASDGTLALRCPDDVELLDIIQKLNSPLACTSANIHGKPATSCSGLSASTIVDCTGAYPRILREGPIPEQVVLDVAIYGATLS